MEMFVVFNIPPSCSLDSFASHIFRVFFHLNTIKKQGLSRDLRSFCLVIVFINLFEYYYILSISYCKIIHPMICIFVILGENLLKSLMLDDDARLVSYDFLYTTPVSLPNLSKRIFSNSH